VSRGLGAAQRFVMDALSTLPAGEWIEVPALAERRHGRPVTVAELESVRRAIRRLEAMGQVEKFYNWGQPNKTSNVRLPVSQERPGRKSPVAEMGSDLRKRLSSGGGGDRGRPRRRGRPRPGPR
jgi:hypothetical protein